MQSTFGMLPWIMPKEPDSILQFFELEGIPKKFSKGQMIPHGRKDGFVSIISSGLVEFCFLDVQYQQKTFSLSPPGRSIGDLEVFDIDVNNYAIAIAYHASDLLIVSREKYKAFLRSSVSNMEDYAISANKKHQCVMDGMIANYTLPLDMRLKLALHSFVLSGDNPVSSCWNTLPFDLTVTEISKIISANRSWVSHTLNLWITKGLIQKHGRAIKVHGSLFDDVL